MAIKPRYGRPLQIPTTDEMRNAVEAIAELEERSVADVGRELIQSGLNLRTSSH